jgi:hypothetical protein
METDNLTQNNSWSIPPLSKKELLREKHFERKERIILSILLLFGCIASILFEKGCVHFISQKLNSLEKEEDSSFDIFEEKKNNRSDSTQKIAYVTNGNIHIFDLNSNSDREITNDGNVSTGISYSTLAWKNQDELSFSKCTSQECTIQNYVYSTSNLEQLTTLEATMVNAIRWSHNGDKLAMWYTGKTGGSLDIWNNGNNNTIKKGIEKINRANDFNDSIYIRFSPDDKKILLTNTFAQENQPYILVLDESGIEIDSIKKEGSQFPTFPFFMTNEVIYYRKDAYLYMRSLQTKEEHQVTDRISGAFDFIPSFDRSKISFWTYDWNTGITTIWYFDIGNETIKRLHDQMYIPFWGDDQTLLGIMIKDCKQCSKDKFETSGISKYDMETKTFSTLLELSNITNISADNL